MNRTGIGLLVYDRPGHTRRVLDGLRKNDVDRLWVFADGSADDADSPAVERTRNVVRDVDWCDVELVARTHNVGLKASWKNAYDQLFNEYDRAIILEDDCVPASDFVEFMTACLDRYEGEERVMNVHGYCPPIDVPGSYPYDVFLTRRSGSWGQATWQSAWEKYEEDPTVFERIKRSPELRRQLDAAGADLFYMMERDVQDRVDSVGVWWSWTLVKHDGLSVNPVKTRVRNIGHDGTGTHSTTTDRFETTLGNADTGDLRFPPSVEPQNPLDNRFRNHIVGGIRGRLGRLVDRYAYKLGLRS